MLEFEMPAWIYLVGFLVSAVFFSCVLKLIIKSTQSEYDEDFPLPSCALFGTLWAVIWPLTLPFSAAVLAVYFALRVIFKGK